MQSVITAEKNSSDYPAQWRAISEVAIKAGTISSLDELLHAALNAWLEQVTPQLRWQIAIKLYQEERVSFGRAAEIAGLNSAVFLERLIDAKIGLVYAEITNESQAQQQKELIRGLFKH